MLSWASRLTLAFTGFFPWPGAHLAALRDTIYEWHVILISHPFSYSWTHFFRSFRGCACQNKHFHMVVIAPGLCVAMWQKKGMEHSVGERVFRGLEWGHFFFVECRLITNRCKVPQWCLKRGRHSEVLTKRRKLFVFRRLWVLKMYTPYRYMYICTHIYAWLRVAWRTRKYLTSVALIDGRCEMSSSVSFSRDLHCARLFICQQWQLLFRHTNFCQWSVV